MSYWKNLNIGMFLVVSLGLLLAQPSPAEDAGIKGTTKVRMGGGRFGNKPREKITRVEFAVAPFVEGKPDYHSAISVTSNDDSMPTEILQIRRSSSIDEMINMSCN